MLSKFLPVYAEEKRASVRHQLTFFTLCSMVRYLVRNSFPSGDKGSREPAPRPPSMSLKGEAKREGWALDFEPDRRRYKNQRMIRSPVLERKERKRKKINSDPRLHPSAPPLFGMAVWSHTSHYLQRFHFSHSSCGYYTTSTGLMTPALPRVHCQCFRPVRAAWPVAQGRRGVLHLTTVFWQEISTSRKR